jgi:hypothetical protein
MHERTSPALVASSRHLLREVLAHQIASYGLVVTPQSVALAISTAATMQRMQRMIIAYSKFFRCVWSGGNEICFSRGIISLS